jgi:hypothetical protein
MITPWKPPARECWQVAAHTALLVRGMPSMSTRLAV